MATNRVIYKFPLQSTPGVFPLKIPRGTPMMRVFTYNTATLYWAGVEPAGARLLARMTVGSP